MHAVRCIVDSRIRLSGALPEEFRRDVFKRFEHKNPSFAKLKKMRFATWREPPQIATWRDEPDGGLSVPRGGMQTVREFAKKHGLKLRVEDARCEGRALPAHIVSTIALRGYQDDAVEAALTKQNCLIKSPTASGKTTMGIAMVQRSGRWGLVIVDAGAIAQEWLRRARSELSVEDSDLGFIGNGTFRIAPVTVAFNQAINAIRSEAKLEQLAEAFGIIVADEVQTFAARTFEKTIDRLPAKYRIGVSDDYRRPDRKHFLITDQFGEIAYEVAESVLQERGAVVDVSVVLLPTEFDAPWYRRPGTPIAGKATRLIAELSNDDDRNALIVDRIVDEVEAGHTFLIFAGLNEHCRVLRRMLEGRGVPAGLLTRDNVPEFDRTFAGIESGLVKVGVGNLKSLGKGVNLPSVDRGFAAVPVAKSEQPWRQVRGRIARPKADGSAAAIWYAWDHLVVGKKPARNLMKWSQRVDVWTPGGMIDATRYLKEM